MRNKVKISGSVDAVKYDALERITINSLLNAMSLSREPLVLMPDGTVFERATDNDFEKDILICLGSDENISIYFDNSFAKKFAEENNGLFIPLRKEDEKVNFKLEQYIEGIKRLSARLPDGKLKSSNNDFISDIESELKYLSNVEPIIGTGRRLSHNYKESFGIKGKIVDFDRKGLPEKKFGHENNQYVITLSLGFDSIGKKDVYITFRRVSADILVNPLIAGESLSKYSFDILKEFIGSNKNFYNNEQIETIFKGKGENNSYDFAELSMVSPKFNSKKAPLTTKELLAEFVPVADKISNGFVKMNEKSKERQWKNYKSAFDF